MSSARLCGLAFALAASLAGCSRNTLTSTGDAPYRLGGVRSALWMQTGGSDPDEDDEQGYAKGVLILTSADYGCGGFEKQINGETDLEDAIWWKSEGLLASFYWQDSNNGDPGWEGSYFAGRYFAYDEAPDTMRMMTTSVFSDGALFESYYSELGRGDITAYSGDTVGGEITTETLRATFQAENCGELEYEGEDTAYPYDYDY